MYLENGWRTFNFLKGLFLISPQKWDSDIKPLFLCRDLSSEEEFLRLFHQVTGQASNTPVLVSTIKKNRIYDLKNTLVYEDVLPTFRKCKHARIPLGIISNQTSLYEISYFNSVLPSYVDAMVFSNRLGVRKPHKLMYLEFCRQMGVEPNEVLMIGDSYAHDYCMPLSIGMKAVHLDRSQQNKVSPTTINTLHDIFDFL